MDVLSLLDLRDFAGLRLLPRSIQECLLPLLLRLGDAYRTPPPSLESLIREFHPWEVSTCRFLSDQDIWRRTNDCVRESSAKDAESHRRARRNEAQRIGRTYPYSCRRLEKGASHGETSNFSADIAHPRDQNSVAEHTAASTTTQLSCLWNADTKASKFGDIDLMNEIVNEFCYDASTILKTGKSEALLGSSWTPLLPLFLPALYLGAFAPTNDVDKPTVCRSPLSGNDLKHDLVPDAKFDQRMGATSMCSELSCHWDSIVAFGLQCVCAYWDDFIYSTQPLQDRQNSERGQKPSRATCRDVASVVELQESPSCAVKPLISLILCCGSMDASIMIADKLVAACIDSLKNGNFMTASLVRHVMSCVADSSPSLASLVFMSVSSADLSSTSLVGALRVQTFDSVDRFHEACSEQQFSLTSVRDFIPPSMMAGLLARMGGSPVLKAELLLIYYFLCFDYEQQQRQRLIDERMHDAATSTRTPGEVKFKGGTEEGVVASYLLAFLEASINDPPRAANKIATVDDRTDVRRHEVNTAEIIRNRAVMVFDRNFNATSMNYSRSWDILAAAEVTGLVRFPDLSQSIAQQYKESFQYAFIWGVKIRATTLYSGVDQRARVVAAGCEALVGAALKHPNTWTDVMDHIILLLYDQINSGELDMRDPYHPFIHSVLVALLPAAAPFAGCLSNHLANQMAFEFVAGDLLRGIVNTGAVVNDGWGNDVNPSPELVEAEASVRRSIVRMLSGGVNNQYCHQSTLAHESGKVASRSRRLLSPSHVLVSCRLYGFLLTFAEKAVNSMLVYSPFAVAKRQGRIEGGDFSAIPYAGFQRWLHVVNVVCELLQIPSADGRLFSVPSLLDFNFCVDVLQRHRFPANLEFESVRSTLILSRDERYSLHHGDRPRNSMALVVLYLIAKFHSLPQLRDQDSAYLRRLHLLPWNSAMNYCSAEPLMGHWLLRPLTEAVNKCVPEVALLGRPVSPQFHDVVRHEFLNPAMLNDASFEDVFSKMTAGVACEPFSENIWKRATTTGTQTGDSTIIESSIMNTECGQFLPSVISIHGCVKSLFEALLLHHCDTGTGDHRLRNHPAHDIEFLKLLLSSDPVAAAAALVECFVTTFVLKSKERTTAEKERRVATFEGDKRCYDFESRQDAVSTTEDFVDAHYFNAWQNPLNMLIQVPANLLVWMIELELLEDCVFVLLFKMETYASMGPSEFKGYPSQHLHAEDMVQIQEAMVFQLLIEACSTVGGGIWELLGRLLDRQAVRRPHALKQLFSLGFPLLVADNLCRMTGNVQRLLPMLGRLLRETVSGMWSEEKVLSPHAMDSAGAIVSQINRLLSDLHIDAEQMFYLHPGLTPSDSIARCLFYLKCIVCIACDLRDNQPYPSDGQETIPSHASEKANSLFLEAVKQSYVIESTELCRFVAAAVPIIFPLYYIFPKLAQLVSEFLSHQKLWRSRALRKKAPPAPSLSLSNAENLLAAKKKLDDVLLQLENDLKYIIELDD